MWATIGFALVAGCGFAPAAVTAAGDAHLGDTIDAPDIDANPNCFGSRALDRVCLTVLPGGSMTFTGHDLDTDGPSCFATTANGVPVCVIAYQAITLTTSSFTITGSKPLVLVATAGAITLNTGLVDIGSHFGRALPGAAAQSGAACTSGATGATAFGGGYGGTFTLVGGAGGVDNNSTGAGAPATPQPAPPTKLAGGCPGDIGGGNLSAASDGGGAIALIAQAININATLTAGGAGGAGTGGTGTNVGGNGGGAGGLIVLDANTVNGTGLIFARGGGGGEGSAGNTGVDGHDGYDLMNAGLSTLPGAGGSQNGGDGGQGGATIAALPGGDGFPGGAQAGGGGGGGGAGLTIVLGATPAGTLTFSPSHQ